jgi:co-chaperonin GroES (HSP10)
MESKTSEIKTEGGVVIDPSKMKLEYAEGTVGEVGEGVTSLKPGDVVLIPNHAGILVSALDTAMRIVEEEEVLAKVVESED